MNDDTHRRMAATEPGSHGARSLRLSLAAALAAAMLACVVWAAGSAAGDSGGVGIGSSRGDTGDRYQRLWNDLSRSNKRWARRTSDCESGGNRKIHGGGGSYHGAFQFMLSTWRSAPKSQGGDPHRKSWKTQAVVAVYLKKRDGARNHWPVCG
jgi:hypothetical protein